MEIKTQHITIQDIVQYSAYLKECQGYADNGENGVYGMNGKLNIRPAYQREFVYKDSQREAVISSIMHGFPLGAFYFAENKDGSYEVLDGQQRLISIGQYLTGIFSLNHKRCLNLPDDQVEQILNYKLMVYICKGTTIEKLDWFRTINIAGEKLTDQELLNATYSGPWLSDAKRYFSKSNCPAHDIGSNYLKGAPIRQDYLETALKWISENKIEDYMADHQHNSDAKELWVYFEQAISWFAEIFPTYRKEMKGLPIGSLYNKLKHNTYDADEIEISVARLMIDEDVTKKSGIYLYILTGEEKYLNIRTFENSHKRETYEKQQGVCPHCKEHFSLEEMEADHITPWSEGGKTESDNCQMLCVHCNRRKSAK